jgi:hypothetical protein
MPILEAHCAGIPCSLELHYYSLLLASSLSLFYGRNSTHTIRRFTAQCWLVGAHRSTSERLVDLVLAHCSRWRRFLLIPSHRTVELNWLYVANDRLATLETLVVRSTRSPTVKIPDIFMTAPNLRKMILADWHFEFSPPAPAISWPHITHYSGALTADSQVAILRAVPNLLSCAIGFPHVVDFALASPSYSHGFNVFISKCRDFFTVSRHLYFRSYSAGTVMAGPRFCPSSRARPVR